MIIRGEVVRGLSLGRKLGFPTANVAIEEKLPVENGVYLSRILIQGIAYKAISNVGFKPTIGNYARGVESHLLDFEGDIYGQMVEIELIEKLRDEMHFENLEALQRQVKLDILKAKNLK
ncbi:MAG: riboflavin kinase [Rikenellaceae bacterium]